MTPTARTTDVAALALEYGDRLVLGTVRDVHTAVAHRVFGATRIVGSRVPEAVHDAVAGSVYGSLSRVLRASGTAARSMAARGVGAPVDGSRVGRQVRSAVNGLVGEELRLMGDPQAITMSLRRDGTDIAATPWKLRQAYPDATGHLVVLVHGLCENDESWLRRGPSVTYAERIAADTEATTVLLRYNTGLHVSENGQHLDELLEQVVANWPVAVHRITLVGHSMGGLVVRAATNRATVAGHLWPHRVGDVVCLGTPHAGANLEKAAHLGSRILRFWPQSTPFGAIRDSRSAGIVDLRHGYISADDWEGQDLTARWGLDRIAAAPLAHAEYHFVAATVGAGRWHPLGAALGDLIVHFSSAAGIGRDGPVAQAARLEYLPSAHHFALLNHPRVGDWLVAWINAKPRQTRRLGS
ncbi:lipase family alpha/beta hydrolase [Aeromicrobium duanguangcaii]|uniref:Alpha/beta hydrolase n=1 Tax=Aeromicrobium duanguangcaii TaxID=2968086 RepID=A0ABY5KI95_9ACTN|nr:alpha/beta hydrolase [Aeromicrobium duanguangcaii]MCD9153731.1 alpha/beta hydrolase [Aeromicrobium duanguangcaii]UUI69191.1 alpha/beta hydrolase [Aeromicrobium duanguangcaii]